MKTMQTTLASRQQGATLIIVMMVLLLIMVAGAMAVRQSRVDLQVATGDQINTVLLQTADNANQKLESIINGDTSTQEYNDLVLNGGGMFGYFYGKPDRAGDEFIYCQTPGNKQYLAAQSTIRKASGGIVYGKGYCSTGTGNTMTYTSGRNVLVGQVSLTPSPVPAVAPPALSHLTVGQDITGPVVKKMQFDIRSISAIPAYTRSSSSDVASCFRNSHVPRTGTTTVDQCLEGLSVPQTAIYQQAHISQVTSVAMCVDFGRGEFKTSAKCQLGSLPTELLPTPAATPTTPTNP